MMVKLEKADLSTFVRKITCFYARTLQTSNTAMSLLAAMVANTQNHPLEIARDSHPKNMACNAP